MKTIKIASIALISMMASAFTINQATKWTVKDEAYVITFKGPKAEGIFKGLKANINFDAGNLEQSKFSATIDVNTINTGNGMKNKHAKSEDALNAKQFPTISFESSSILKKADSFEAIGKLTIKGITKELVLPFTFEIKNNEGIFKGKFLVNTKDFSINRTGVPEKVEIDLVIPTTNK